MFKKIISLIFLVLLTKFSYSQLNLYSDSVKVLDSTILIATSTQYKQYEFCIEKKNDVIKELKRITYKEAKEYKYEKFPIVIKLVTKGKITKIWNVHLLSSIIEVEGEKYSFDTTLLSVLHKKFPIDYVVEEKVFNSEEQQEDYYLNLLNEKHFLYIVPHDFENEWKEKFNLTFQKNERFTSPVAIAKYLDTTIFKTIPKEKYSTSYSPFDVAKIDSTDKFTLTIYSINELYENLNDSNAIKSGLTFYPTYIIRKK